MLRNYKMTITLSPSSINLFIEEKALWVLKHFYKMYGDTNIYAVRGKVAEEVVNESLRRRRVITFEDFLPYAVGKTLMDNIEITREDYEKFYEWGVRCYEIIRGFNVVATQRKLEGEIHETPVMGYTDFFCKEEANPYGTHIDLKTVSKTPSTLTRGDRQGMLPAGKAANVRQQVVYSILSERTSKALIFIDEEGSSLRYDITKRDVDEHTPLIKKAIKDIRKLLSLEKEELLLKTPPKVNRNGNSCNSFFWCDRTRRKANVLWRKKG